MTYDCKTKNQIDHTTIEVLNVENGKRVDMYSDHHFLVGDIPIKLATANQNKILTESKYNVTKLTKNQ